MILLSQFGIYKRITHLQLIDGLNTAGKHELIRVYDLNFDWSQFVHVTVRLFGACSSDFPIGVPIIFHFFFTPL